jgi:hypothetical protein
VILLFEVKEIIDTEFSSKKSFSIKYSKTPCPLLLASL